MTTRQKQTPSLVTLMQRLAKTLTADPREDLRELRSTPETPYGFAAAREIQLYNKARMRDEYG